MTLVKSKYSLHWDECHWLLKLNQENNHAKTKKYLIYDNLPKKWLCKEWKYDFDLEVKLYSSKTQIHRNNM